MKQVPPWWSLRRRCFWWHILPLSGGDCNRCNSICDYRHILTCSSQSSTEWAGVVDRCIGPAQINMWNPDVPFLYISRPTDCNSNPMNAATRKTDHNFYGMRSFENWWLLIQLRVQLPSSPASGFYIELSKISSVWRYISELPGYKFVTMAMYKSFTDTYGSNRLRASLIWQFINTGIW